jgi:hypothetical protein
MVCQQKAYHVYDLAELSRQYGVDTQSSSLLLLLSSTYVFQEPAQDQVAVWLMLV